MKRLRFHQEVLEEIESTARWYEGQRPGLGDDYIVELDGVLALLESGSLVTSPVPENGRARRVFLSRFPYAVVLLDLGDEFFVLAVAHLRQAPGYWLSRAE